MTMPTRLMGIYCLATAEQLRALIAERFRFKFAKTVSCCALLWAALAVAPVLALADDYYVNNETGDDRNSGTLGSAARDTQQDGPFRTISRALKAAQTGDRVFVEKTETPYRECLTIQGPRHNGNQLKKLHIFSNGAILDGSRPVGDRWEHLGRNIYRFKPERKSYQQLYLDGKPLPQQDLGKFGRISDLESGNWILREGSIIFRTDGRHPLQYDLSYCFHPVGITLYQVHNVAVEGFVIQGFQLDGINAHDGVSETVLLSNILRGNGRSGLSVGGASKVNVVACLIGDNGASQLRTEGESQTTIENCNILESDDFGPPIHQDGGRVARK